MIKFILTSNKSSINNSIEKINDISSDLASISSTIKSSDLELTLSNLKSSSDNLASVLDNINNNLEEPLFDALGTNNSEEIYVFSKEKQETALVNENEKLYQEEELANYDKQQKYKQNLNLEVTSKDDVKDEKINNDNNIKHKKNSNGELDLDFLDIPAFLRKQAD